MPSHQNYGWNRSYFYTFFLIVFFSSYRLLPEWLPLHPHRWWIHVRNVFTPMSYLWAVRFKAPENELILSLRKEIFNEDYYKIDWPKYRNHVAKVDIYHPHSTLCNLLFGALGIYDGCAIPPVRAAGLERVYQLIVKEDENTGYQTLGPVSKMLNLVSRVHAEGIGSDAWKQHKLKRLDFLWMGSEGLRMCGTNGSQLWDTAFISQALVETGLALEKDFQPHTIKALEWLDDCQIRGDPRHDEYRHTSKGAWPFSTREQSYTVSDCTGEGLKAVLYLQDHLKC
jgi:lanosterol synthase